MQQQRLYRKALDPTNICLPSRLEDGCKLLSNVSMSREITLPCCGDIGLDGQE